MVKYHDDKFRDRELAKYYVGQLTYLSTQLFAKRCDILTSFYGDVFDDDPSCIRLIDAPRDRPGVTPTMYMVYREARFVLDSPRKDNTDLIMVWHLLHMQIRDEISPAVTAQMARHNACVRQHIMARNSDVQDFMPKMQTMLDAGKYKKVTQHGHNLLASVKYTFDSIIDSYSDLALHQH